MKNHKITYIVITLLLFSFFLNTDKLIVHATNEDPGIGRLSGSNIPDSFYDSNDATKDFSNPLHWYGDTKTKSPYNNTTYKHQDRFDTRTILHGIDVSKWQGEIDWAKVKADGIDYAFIQVGYRGYGSTGLLSEATKDPYFDVNMQNAIAAGVRVGVYVFSQATTEAEAIEEAEYILNAIGGYAISMPLVLDYEYASTTSGLGGRLYKAKLSRTKATNICMAFCNEIAAAGYTPMIYANKSMLEDQLNATTFTNAGYRIWLANYTKNTSYQGNFDFWQYSEKGKVNGIYGDVDMNFYYAQPDDNFSPNANSIATSTFSEVSNQTYTGNPITPEITIAHNGITLIPNIDYTITYSNNVKMGTATITIAGIGNYCNVRNIRFKILPSQATSFKAKKRSTKYITLSWKKNSGIKGYEIYRANEVNGTFKKVKTITKNKTISFKNNNLTPGKCYYYQIRTYKTLSGTKYYSDFSPILSVYTKTGYTRNAITKYKTPIYDYIPGTKTETKKIPIDVPVAPETTETTTENTTEGPSESTSETTTEDSSENTSEKTTEDSSENTSEATTEDSSEATSETTPEDTSEKTENTFDTSEESPVDTITDATTNKAEMPTTPESTSVEIQTNNNTDINTTGDNPSETAPGQTITVTENVASTTLLEVPKNTVLNVVYSTKYKKQTWYYVQYTYEDVTYRGFVKSSKVTIAKQGKIVKTKKVNVRKKYTVNSKKITTLKKNSKVNIISTKVRYGVKWYKVQFEKNNKIYNGWISSPYVKVI